MAEMSKAERRIQLERLFDAKARLLRQLDGIENAIRHSSKEYAKECGYLTIPRPEVLKQLFAVERARGE